MFELRMVRIATRRNDALDQCFVHFLYICVLCCQYLHDLCHAHVNSVMSISVYVILLLLLLFELPLL